MVDVVRREQKVARAMHLEEGSVSAFVSGAGRTTIAVAGSARLYDLQLHLMGEDGAEDWSGALWCYELHSLDPRLDFEWSACSERPLMNFSVVNDPGPTSYAAWVDLTVLCFEEISAGRDLAQGLAVYFAPEDASPVFRVGVTGMVDSDEFVGRSSVGLDIRPRYIDRDADGRWTVKVSGPNSGRVYTFVSSDGVVWKRH